MSKIADHTMSFRLPTESAEKLKKIADTFHASKGDILRKILEKSDKEIIDFLNKV